MCAAPPGAPEERRPATRSKKRIPAFAFAGMTSAEKKTGRTRRPAFPFTRNVRSSELDASLHIVETTRQIVVRRIVAVERTAQADRRILVEDVVDATRDRDRPLRRQFPLHARVVVRGAAERVAAVRELGRGRVRTDRETGGAG